MTAVLERCLKQVEPRKRKTATQAELAAIDEAIARAETTISGLYGFEQPVKEAVTDRLEGLRRERAATDRVAGGYRKFASLAPLSWRDKATGYPKLVLFSLDSPTFAITARVSRRREWWSDYLITTRSASIAPALPKPLADCYADVMSALKKNARRTDRTVRLACSYKGYIPEKTRAKIEAAKKAFSHVFIMAEGANWELTSRAPRVVNDGDPLVVGWDGKDLWLIDKFDLTTTERLIATQFTV